ncbi:MAG: hypothetical protein GC182_08720 [Rhodopseudomonas sp.]|nr:hypothetical protein [Rhodopseudomonas sp.]
MVDQQPKAPTIDLMFTCAGTVRGEKTRRGGALFSASLVAAREEGAERRRNAETIDQMFDCAGAVRRRFAR